MNLFVDTSVWSLALRRDHHDESDELRRLEQALLTRETVTSTGLVLQELLQGFRGARAHDAILQRFSVIPFVSPDRNAHVEAAEIRNRCRRSGVQLGTVDALLASLCIRHDLEMLTTDHDFLHASRVVPLAVWRPTSAPGD